MTDADALEQCVAEVVDLRSQLRGAEEVAAQLCAIVQCSDDAIICSTLDGIITSWNPGAERMYGYTAAEIVGRPVDVLVPPSCEAEARQILHRVRAGERVPSFETRRRRKDGQEIRVAVSVSPLFDAAGQVVGAVKIAHDMTETHRLQEQLRQAQKMEALGRLAGGVAHDFNNLLTVIGGYSEMVEGALPASDPGRPLVQQIRKAADRAASLVRQLLAFSRRTAVQPVVLDLNAVVASSEKMLRRLVGEDVVLTTVLAAAPVVVKADAAQLEQAIFNLAVNARDAMPQGGRLTLETEAVQVNGAHCRAHPEAVPGRYARLAVTDDGCGMSEETQAHLFEPFFTTKAAGKGTGLGLAMVHGFTHQSGGHIAVHSEPGRGTRFEIYLPLARADGPLPRSHSGLGRRPAGWETVLVVEDEEGVRTLTRRLLEGCGYTVLEARNGEEAVQAAAAHPGPIHLLLTDVVMPGLSGRRAAEEVAAVKPGVKTLYTSGHPDDAVVRHGIREADVAFLPKPYDAATLTRKVREVLDHGPPAPPAAGPFVE